MSELCYSATTKNSWLQKSPCVLPFRKLPSVDACWAVWGAEELLPKIKERKGRRSVVQDTGSLPMWFYQLAPLKTTLPTPAFFLGCGSCSALHPSELESAGGPLAPSLGTWYSVLSCPFAMTFNTPELVLTWVCYLNVSKRRRMWVQGNEKCFIKIKFYMTCSLKLLQDFFSTSHKYTYY